MDSVSVNRNLKIDSSPALRTLSRHGLYVTIRERKVHGILNSFHRAPYIMEVSRRMVNHETPCGRSYIVRAWWKISTALCEHRGGARWFIAYENRRTGDSVCRDHRNGSSITKIPPDYRSFFPFHLPFLLFCFRNFYYSPLSLSLEISSNGEIKERISKISVLVLSNNKVSTIVWITSLPFFE